jgi:hypothetical protein
LAPEDPDRALIESWRRRQSEVRDLQARLLGSVEGVDLLQLSTVGFILEQARDMPRRFLDPEDHDFVFSAVEGQSSRELETNLPAIVNYVRLSMSIRAFLPAARMRRPLVGRREGMETLIEIGRGVLDFRFEQLRRVRAGEIPRARVLTKSNLGALGERSTLSRLRQAYSDGHDQFTLQRNLLLVGALAIQLQFGFLVALWIRKKAETFVVVRGRS